MNAFKLESGGFAYMTCIEGENTRLRLTLARLHRKTLCYSKSIEMLKCSLRLLLHYFVVSDGSSASLNHYNFSNAAISSLFWLAYQVTQEFPVTFLEPENVWKVIYVGIAGTLLP